VRVQWSYNLKVSLNRCYVWNWTMGWVIWQVIARDRNCWSFPLRMLSRFILILWELGIVHSRLWAQHWGIMVPFPTGGSLSFYCKHQPSSVPAPPPPHIEWVLCTLPKAKAGRVGSWQLTHPSSAKARMTGAVPPLPHITWWLAQGQPYPLCLKVAWYWLLMNFKLVERLNCWFNSLIFLSSDHLT
jgi:hypothetical protein